MKFFRETKRTFAILGISSNQNIFNEKMLMAFTSYWLDNTLNCIFIYREANSFSEYADSAFITSTTTMFAMIFTIIVIKWQNVSELISSIDELAEKSKLTEKKLEKS